MSTSTGLTDLNDLTDRALSGTLPPAAWDHTAFVLVVAELVRRHGTIGAHRRLRGITERLGVPCAGRGPGGGHHETIVVFYVWAVERLVAAGLDTRRVLWHPLTGPTAVLAWYQRYTLRRPEARWSFVPPDRALPGEPAPTAIDAMALPVHASRNAVASSSRPSTPSLS